MEEEKEDKSKQVSNCAICKKPFELDKCYCERCYNESNKEKLKDLEAQISNLVKKEKDLLIQKETELQDAKIKMLNLEDMLKQMESNMMMKIYKRHLDIDEEVRTKLFKNIKTWSKASLTIQRVWKGYKQRKHFYQQVLESVNRTRSFNKAKVSDQQIMKQIASAVLQRKLTLEQCFRAADVNCDGVVTCDEFTRFLARLDLGISNQQLAKLIMLVDEDCTGTIEAKELYNALESYKVASENQRKSIRSYDQDTLMKFIAAINSKNIEPSELFNMCDTDNSGVISLKELEKLITGLDIGFKLKDINALMRVLDVDNSGELCRDEFLKHIGKAVQLFQIETNIATATMSANQSNKYEKSEWVKGIVENMESKGLGIPEAFDMIETTRSGRVTITAFSRSLAKLYPHVSQNDLLKLIAYMDIDRDNMIDLNEFQQFLNIYTSSSKFSIRGALNQIANIIDKEGGSTLNFLANKGVLAVLDISSFIKLCESAFLLLEEQSIQVFNFLDSERRGGLSVKQIESVLEKYRKNSFQEYELKETSGEPLSPRSLAQNSIEELNKGLDRCGLKPLNIFRLADKNRTGSITTLEFQAALGRLAKGIDQSLIRIVMNLFPSGVLTENDINAIFNAPTIKAIQKLDKNGLTVEEVYWLQRFESGIARLGVTPESIFVAADLNRNGNIDVQELRGAIKKCLPGSILTHTDICYIAQAMDVNKNGQIDRNEFTKRLSDARVSNHNAKLIQDYAKSKQANLRVDEELKITGTNKLSGLIAKKLRPLLPPLPLKHLMHRELLVAKIQRIIISCPSSTPIHIYFDQFGIQPKSLINLQRFIKIGRKCDLSDADCQEILQVLDLNNRGNFYAFTLFAVLDSYRFNILNLPIPQNPNAEKSIISILTRVAEKFNENKPLYRQFPELTSQVLDWGLLTFLGIEHHELELLKPYFPSKCYIYHLAAVIQSYQYTITLCGEQIMLCAYAINNIDTQAANYFAPYNMNAADTVEKADFVSKLIVTLKLNPVEADAIHRTVYGLSKEAQPLYHFYTYFDMFLSMFNDSGLLFPFPKIPIYQREDLDLVVKSFFKRVAENMSLPLVRYGINLVSDITENELGELMDKHLNVRKQEASTYCALLKFNKNQKIRVYHLITVLDSYRASPINSSFVPRSEIDAINRCVTKNISAFGWLLSSDLQMDFRVSISELSLLFPLLTKSELTNLFNFIDSFDRGFVFAHQIMTMIDLAHFTQGDIAEFPFMNNPKTPRDVKTIFQQIAKNLDLYNKTAFQYYLDIHVDPEEVLDLIAFVRSFSNDFTSPEATAIFRTIEIKSCTRIRVYHFFACLETYCKNTNLSSVSQNVSTETLSNLGLKIPDALQTPEYFNDISVHELFDIQRFIKYMHTKLGMSIELSEQLFAEIDKKGNQRIFGFQIWTRFDLNRCSIENGRICYEMPTLPYVWQPGVSGQVQLLLKAIAQKLDVNEKGTCEHYWDIGINVLSEFSISDFIVCNHELNEQQSAEIFRALDIKKQARIMFYHFLDVIESYRSRQKPSNIRSKQVTTSMKHVSPLINPIQPTKTMTPLQDAFNKLGRYIAGDNPQNRKLSSQDMFGMLDINRDGIITPEEFFITLNSMNLDLTDQQKLQLVREADLNKDAKIDYEEFMNFVMTFVSKDAKKMHESSGLVKLNQRPGLEILNADLPLETFKSGSVEQAVLKLKQYIFITEDSFSKLDVIFKKLDEFGNGTVNQTEFFIALDRTKLGLSPQQKDKLFSLADRDRIGNVKYDEFIDYLYKSNLLE